FTAKPVTTERSTWGGLRHEQVADLQIGDGKRDQMTPWAHAVARVVDGVIADGPQRLSKFREDIEDDRQSMSEHFSAFKANVSTPAGNGQGFLLSGAPPPELAV